MKSVYLRSLSVILSAFCLFAFTNTYAQDEKEKKDEGYVFTNVKEIKSTPVKNQYKSGTCWSFASTSFLEAELLRMGKGEFDLSEMFSVRKAYAEKAVSYVRLHGNITFAAGGEGHDVLNIIRKYGMVPEEAYSGKNIGEDEHIHFEMDAVLKAMVDAVIKNENKKLTPRWLEAVEATLDVYLGKIPETFTYNGKSYTARTFADNVLTINPDNYIELTSYTHHPFYTDFILELPDNWSLYKAYNLPIDEFMAVIDNSINNGYTLCFAADVSDKGFSFKNNVAIIPEEDLQDMTDTEREKWEKLTDAEKEKQLYKFDKPCKEKQITQEMRQQNFDNYTTTDDHLMHITGIAKDQNGTKYYLVKNSWGTKDNDYKGYFYASEAYLRLNTLSIIVNKEAIPKDIAKKLGIK